MLFSCEKKHRRAIAVDETKVKLENQWVYIWSAIDVDDRSILAVHGSITRTSLDANIYFLRKVFWNTAMVIMDGCRYHYTIFFIEYNGLSILSL